MIRLPTCNYCQKILLTDAQIKFGYCSSRCKDKNRGEISTSKVNREVERLMRQYDQGGVND